MRDFVFPMFRANAVYEGEYLLGTSIARPLIAKRLVEIAREDGRRCDLARRDRQGQRPGALRARRLRAHAGREGHRAVARVGPPLAREAARLRREARHPGRLQEEERRRALLDGREPAAHLATRAASSRIPNYEPEESMWRITVSPEKAPDKPEYVELDYERGDIVAVNGKKMTPAKVLTELNRLGGKHGIGRLDLVENRYVGMKSRGCYETPGGTIMLKAHRAIESITLDREVLALKDDLMPRYARMIYNGYWFSPERQLLQTLIDESQKRVNGTVRLKLYKGTVMVTGRESRTDSLFDPAISTFEDDKGAYNQADAAGFIQLNALRMRIAANAEARRRG